MLLTPLEDLSGLASGAPTESLCCLGSNDVGGVQRGGGVPLSPHAEDAHGLGSGIGKAGQRRVKGTENCLQKFVPLRWGLKLGWLCQSLSGLTTETYIS